ncbi:MAG: thiamine pyrophosphate-binding protein [Desulfuromonadaceae bacterium]|nr:thiamine pyrophosphate-binding protein [Desulfuromonadaceae bacterium]MDD5107033.1 thiamine pyrophosphate-binding protein [Desulfuromonadaceae bacterium]
MAEKTGRHAIIEQFLADGMSVMFGNPGTVEQGFLDALRDYPEMHYILTLQESVAVLMADGYARATRRPTLVQLHSTPGLGNAIGALYQAKRGHAPLVVIGGDSGIKYSGMDAQMAGDLVAIAEPVTKWSTMVMHPSSLLRTIRRAIKIAATPPMGPVYVCLPMDILDEPCTESVFPACLPSTRTVPAADDLVQAASWLAAAEKPMIFVGDGVAYSGAQEELTRVAEMLGAEVWGVDSGELNMAYDHPLYRGQTGHMFGEQSLPIMQRGDANLICGTYVLPEVFPLLGEVFAPGAKTIHIDLNAYEIAKNHPVSLGVVSDPKLTLKELAIVLKAIQTTPQIEEAARRTGALTEAKIRALRAEQERDMLQQDAVPMQSSCFMKELARQLPADAIIFDEALTNSPALTRYLPPRKSGEFFQTRGGSLGVGVPGAIGAKLANPGRTVIGFSGDGGSMYTIQALWSAARHNVAAKFVICNNSSYRLLQLNIDAYWKERGMISHEYPLCFDLSRPQLRFDEMAKSMGVASVRVEKPCEVGAAIHQMLAHQGPFLIDLVLEGDVHPDMIGLKCGQ